MASIINVDKVRRTGSTTDAISISSSDHAIIPGHTLQVQQALISEATLSADTVIATITWTPKQSGSKVLAQLYIPNVTGDSGNIAIFEIFLGPNSTYDNGANTKVARNRVALDGTGAAETITAYCADYGLFTTSSTSTHYAFAVFKHQTNVVVARHGDGTDATKGKLIIQEIAQ